MKRLFSFAAFLLLCIGVYGQEIRSIATKVYIDGDGDALIRQTWDVNVVSGTEWYIPIGNLGEMQIRGLKVWENGEEFMDEGRSWDSNRSREQKRGRSGIIEKGRDGVEICWGIGSTGDHEWQIEYVALGLVQSLEDYDAFNYMFVNPELVATPRTVSLDFYKLDGGPFNSDSTRFWFFGTEGFSELREDGTIHFEASDMRNDHSVICMMRFEKGVFAPYITRDCKFEAMQKKAFKGSSYKTSDNKNWDLIIDLFFEILIAVVVLGFALFLLALKIRDQIMKATGRQWKESVFGARKVDGWAREAPFGGSIPIASAVLEDGSRLNFKPDDNGRFICAYFLKWIAENKVTPVKAEDGHYDLIFPEECPDFDDSAEKSLYIKAFDACGENRILEKGEFDTWAEKHYRSLTGWPDKLRSEGRSKLAAYKGDNKIAESANLLKFRNFLKDFTLAKEREVPEVSLWGEYLVFAEVFGIADQVAEGLSKRFPEQFSEFSQRYGLDSVEMRNVIHNWNISSQSALDQAAIQKELSEAASSSSSSSGGFGGSSSIGGGGGFSGGGRGGGSR